jgi:hypothetical protein
MLLNLFIPLLSSLLHVELNFFLIYNVHTQCIYLYGLLLLIW